MSVGGPWEGVRKQHHDNGVNNSLHASCQFIECLMQFYIYRGHQNLSQNRHRSLVQGCQYSFISLRYYTKLPNIDWSIVHTVQVGKLQGYRCFTDVQQAVCHILLTSTEKFPNISSDQSYLPFRQTLMSFNNSLTVAFKMRIWYSPCLQKCNYWYLDAIWKI